MSAFDKIKTLDTALFYLEAAEELIASLRMDAEARRLEDVIEEVEHERDFIITTELPETIPAKIAGKQSTPLRG